MADMLSIGSSALNAYKRALDTTGHNVANAATEGYSRQRVEFSSRVSAGASIGSGVGFGDITRIVDDLVGGRLIGDSSSSGRLEVLSSYTGRIDRLYSDPDTGIAGAVDSFFAGLSRLSSDPASTALRTEVIGAAQDMASTFNRVGGALSQYQAEINRDLEVSVSDINRLSGDIADFNQKIAIARGTGITPNDLLDKRDLALQELAGLIDIETVVQDSGDTNVFTGNGQALVLGNSSNEIGLEPDPFKDGNMQLTLAVGGREQPIGSNINGGRVGGLLDARDAVEQDLGRIGRLAATIANQINAQQQQGVDFRGQVGSALFSGENAFVFSADSNSGQASVEVDLSDLGALTGDSYELRFNGGFELVNRRTGELLQTTGAGTAADPLVAEGLSISVNGTPVNGDRFLLKPTSAAALSMGVSVTDQAGLAAAGLMSAGADAGNIGVANPAISVADPVAAQAQIPATIEFLDSTTYSVNGAGNFAYDATAGIDINGFNIKLDGEPLAGDVFTLQPTAANSGDNRNALSMATIGEQTILAGGTRSFSDENAGIIASAGDRARQASRQADAAASIFAQDRAQRDSISGVNLDEEAANLLRFQQGYQAAARVIETASQMFQTLLSAVSR